MLQCNMKDGVPTRLALEDLLTALWHARRADDVGRLAHLASCKVQDWARARRDRGLAAHARGLLTDCPYRSRQEFMFAIDQLIAEVEQAHVELVAYDRHPVSYVRLGPSRAGRQASSPSAS